MDADASSRSELQLGALYGRYRHWRPCATLSSDLPPLEASTDPSPASLRALVIQFEGSAREDLRVGFAASPDVAVSGSAAALGAETRYNVRTEWTYEVAIGLSGNTEVVWRKAASGRSKEVDLARVFTGRTCSAQDFVPYWIVVELTNGSMAVGVGPHVGQDVLATCRDPDFVPVALTAFTSWDSPVSLRGIQVHGVYEGQMEALAAADVSAFPPPRLVVRADALGREDLLTAEQRQKFEAEYEASKRRADRFGTAFVPPDIKTVMDPRDVRKLQRTGAVVPGFSTGIDITSEKEQGKREQRMKRFDTPQFAVNYSAETAKALEQGLTQEEWVQKQHDQEKLRARAQKYGLSAAEDRSQVVPSDLHPASAKVGRERLDVKAAEGQTVAFRDDALHMYSLDEKFQEVRTSDVMEYFVGYGPAYVEWLNDSSCTIVFQDNFTSARALIALGQKVPPQILEQTKKEKANAGDALASGEDVNMEDAEPHADADSATAMNDGEEEVEIPHDAFNRSQWYMGNKAIGSKTQPRDKKWRVLLRKATDEDFPPEKMPKKGMYHSRSSRRHDAGSMHPRNGRNNGSSRRGRSRAHPYGGDAREIGGSEESAGRQRRRSTKDDIDTGKPSKRIRVNADGSINIVRDEQAISNPE
ncbi:unnamed protein product [Hyaloperonospora brassicae]|uniref:Farnesoic acid O-methyl transferase domain-containing protein n=1 Tax=Hyaloperonospora brassicae TaxID=162125 RepID=A0AAV0V026_HYABA|nr:unnamed protein product [Hyaloperonospora brassicae]